MEYLLILVMQFSIGISQEPLILIGDRYDEFAECQQQGLKTANWLTQDFVTVEVHCVGQHTALAGRYAVGNRRMAESE